MISRRQIKLKNFNQQKLIGIIIIIMFIGFSVVRPEFASIESIDNILRTLSLFGIASLGMTLVILLGGTDLSAGSNMAFSGVVGAGLLGSAVGAVNPIKLPFIVTVIIALLLSGLVSAFNGFVITRLNIAPFVTTLATMSIVRGFVYIVADFVVGGVSGSPITFMNDGYTALGQGSIGPIPIQTVLFIVIFIMMYIFLKHTSIGREIYAVGGNKEIANLAGINASKITILCYTISGVLIGISGLILVGKLSSASTVAAKGYELDLITAVALGGTSMAGGRGSVFGTLLGVTFLSVMNNGLDMINVPSFYQYLIKGIILVLAVCTDRFLQKKVK